MSQRVTQHPIVALVTLVLHHTALVSCMDYIQHKQMT